MAYILLPISFLACQSYPSMMSIPANPAYFSCTLHFLTCIGCVMWNVRQVTKLCLAFQFMVKIYLNCERLIHAIIAQWSPEIYYHAVWYGVMKYIITLFGIERIFLFVSSIVELLCSSFLLGVAESHKFSCLTSISILVCLPPKRFNVIYLGGIIWGAKGGTQGNNVIM